YIQRLRVAIYHNDNRQTDGHFCCCQSHNEEDKNLPTGISSVSGKSRQQKIYRVKHQFNGHHNDNHITTNKDSGYTNSENNTTKNDVVVQWNALDLFYNISHYAFLTSFFANKTAPIIAANNRIDEI